MFDINSLKQFNCIRAEKRRISRRMNELRLETSEENTKQVKKVKELYKELETLEKKQIAAELEITRVLAGITDAQVRLSVQMHYIDGYTWNEVADAIGGGNTEDSCRKYVQRYFKKLSDKSQNNLIQ